jgi:hypothetical protein
MSIRDGQGKEFPTIADAAREFGVSTKTVRDWVIRKIIPTPPEMPYGTRYIFVFPPKYMKEAKAVLESIRFNKRMARVKRGRP